ncbi:hypothetical protein [Fuchsiella alkaliacetigena]|uniref:hypothetical protein n=1 Tax=Fuchsiella alkaliacetigena TaxID=957042 RepID=UPI00200ABB39|nr:hypothetical protein [Fuchsiella alkaliacetigena]MCK8825709.1 hypothetical protein [Fuchsiella alkaliacetigena]
MKNNINDKVEEVLSRIENEKDIDKIVKEVVKKDTTLDKETMKKQIDQLKEEVEKIRKEKEKKEEKLNQVMKIDELEDLEDVDNRDLEEIEWSSETERRKAANKLIHLAEMIKENEYLEKETLKTFNFYREKLVDRCLQEKDFGERVANLIKRK